MEGGMRLRLGWIGVDVLRNATICNEADGLLEAGVDMEIASVERLGPPLFHRSENVRRIAEGLLNLRPLGAATTASRFAAAPFTFGRGFWRAVANAFRCPAEGWRERLRLIRHIAPALKLAFAWRDRNIGHIHAHGAHTAATIAMHAADMLNVGFSFTGYSNDLFVQRVGLAGKVRRARFVVCISTFHRGFYERLGGDPARLPVVYSGVDVRRLQEREDPPKGAARRRILAVGRLVERKGFHDLIAACALLRDRGKRFECVIAGSGPEEQRLRGLAAQRNLGGRVRITGKTVLPEDLSNLLLDSAIFVLPCVKDHNGDMDGLPQVLIESMGRGIPTISTQLAGVSDLVHDRATGFLVEPGDVNALADRIERLLAQPEEAAAVGRRGARWVRRHFGRDESIARLKALFGAVLGELGQRPPAPILEGAPELAFEADTVSAMPVASEPVTV